MKLDLEIFGEEIISREILRFGANANDMRSAFDTVHEDFLEIETEQFNTQGKFSGGWKPLAPSTKAAKAAHGGDSRILHDMLNLRKSLTVASDRGHVYKTTADELMMGSKDPKGKFHQSGTGKMPQRRPVEFTEVHKRSMLKVLQAHIVSGLL